MNDLSDNLADGSFGVENGHLVEYARPRVPWRARVTGAIARSWLQDFYVVRLAANALLAGDPAAPYDSPTSVDLEHALLKEFVSIARERGIPIVLLVVPTIFAQQVQRGAGVESPQRGSEVERFTRVRALVQGLGVPWVDAGAVIPDMAADAATGDGGHFGKGGNTLIGEAIAQQLEPLLRSPTAAAVAP